MPLKFYQTSTVHVWGISKYTTTTLIKCGRCMVAKFVPMPMHGPEICSEADACL